MKASLLSCSLAALLMGGVSRAEGLRIYLFTLKGPAPPATDLGPTIKDRKEGVRVYETLLDVADSFSLDFTDPSFAKKYPMIGAGRSPGERLSGLVRNNGKNTVLRLRFDDCKVVKYVKDRNGKRYPQITASSVEGLGRLEESGWALIDPNDDKTQERQVFLVERIRE